MDAIQYKGATTFEVNGLTVEEHVRLVILPKIKEWGPTTPIDLVYESDTPMSALRKLAGVLDVENP